MKRTHDVLTCILLVACIFTAVAAGWFFVRLNKNVSGLLEETREHTFRNGGLFQEVKKAVNGVKGVAVETSRGEKKYWDDLDSNTKATFGKVNTLVGNIDTQTRPRLDHDLESLGTAIDGIPKVMQTLDGVLGDTRTVLRAANIDLNTLNGDLTATKKAITDLDNNLINDPDIKTLLNNLAQAAGNGNKILGHVEGMSADVQTSLHKYLTAKPSVKSRILLALTVAYKVALLKATLGF